MQRSTVGINAIQAAP